MTQNKYSQDIVFVFVPSSREKIILNFKNSLPSNLIFSSLLPLTHKFFSQALVKVCHQSVMVLFFCQRNSNCCTEFQETLYVLGHNAQMCILPLNSDYMIFLGNLALLNLELLLKTKVQTCVFAVSIYMYTQLN